MKKLFYLFLFLFLFLLSATLKAQGQVTDVSLPMKIPFIIVNNIDTIGGSVDYTKMTTTLHDSLNFNRQSSRVFPAGIISMPSGQSGSGTIFIDSSGVRLAFFTVSFQRDGTTWVTCNSTDKQAYITVGNVGTETFTFYNFGSLSTFKNNNIGSVTARFNINYAAN